MEENEEVKRVENEAGEIWEEALARLYNTPPVGNLLPEDANIDISAWERSWWENAKSVPAPIYNVKWDESKTTYSEPWSITLNRWAFIKGSCIEGMVSVEDGMYELQRYSWYKRWYKLIRYYHIPKLIARIWKRNQVKTCKK